MRPFVLESAATAHEALRMAQRAQLPHGRREPDAGAPHPYAAPPPAQPHSPTSHLDHDHDRPMQFLAGGTTLLDLMKLDVIRPAHLININALRHEFGAIEADADELRLGALVRMSAAADHPAIRRDYPVIADSLRQAASPQLRNMATLAGNVLQRTRCPYYRDTSWKACNRREPGSGCAARDGVNRRLAVLGTSEYCIAHYPGDFANALVALEAQVSILDARGAPYTMPLEDLHRLPGSSPHIETNLPDGHLITGFTVPAQPWTRRSLYLKIRDRASYDFALAAAAVALDLGPDRMVRTARIALGGVATRPWRSHEAEQALQGWVLDETAARRAAEAAFRDASAQGQASFKPELGRRTLVRALLEAAALPVSGDEDAMP